jgi:hypothetical protein
MREIFLPYVEGMGRQRVWELPHPSDMNNHRAIFANELDLLGHRVDPMGRRSAISVEPVRVVDYLMLA